MAKKTRKPKPRSHGVDVTLTRHGGLSYLELPAIDAIQSAAFYEAVVGWTIRQKSADEAKFSDSTGYLIGRWRTDRTAARQPGLLPYIYVNDIKSAVKHALKLKGKVIKPVFAESDLLVALIRDPAGNVIGLWQARG